MLSKLMEIGNFDSLDNEWKEKQAAANTFIEPALEAYFMTLNYNPLEEAPE